MMDIVRSRLVPYAMAAFAAGITLAYLFWRDAGLQPPPVIAFVAPILSLLLCLASGRFFGWKSAQGKVAHLFALSVGFWLVADILWYALYGEAIVSPADGFYLMGYLPLATGLALAARSLRPKRRILPIAAILALAALAYLYLFPLGYKSGLSLAENIFTAGYVIADLLVLLPVILLIYMLAGGDWMSGWVLVALGGLFSLYADLSYAVHPDAYSLGALVDLAWYYGYLLLGLGMWHLAHHSVAGIDRLARHKK